MSNIDKLRDKVAKLLRQAEDVVGTPEEGVFQAKAFELMAKYGISEAAVSAAKEGLDASDLRDAIKWTVNIDGAYANAQMLLLHNMAIALHCKTVYLKDPRGLRMFVYGVPSHIERVKLLWNILQPQMMRLVKTVRPPAQRAYNYTLGDYTLAPARPGQVKVYRRSWIAGFGSVIGQRLREQETQALESDTSGALVLFQGDTQRAEVALRNEHPRLRTQRGPRVNAEGYAHGQRDGRNASFNHSLNR